VTNRAVNYVCYDPVGNRQTMTDNGTNTAYTANNLNQYTAVGTDVPSYDQNGNLTSQAGWTYSYDAQNRLISASSASLAVQFAYDARNRCIKRVTNGTTLYLTYDGWSLIEERDAGDNELARYIHGATIDEILVRNTGSPVYYHHDGLGSTTHVAEASQRLSAIVLGTRLDHIHAVGTCASNALDFQRTRTQTAPQTTAAILRSS